MGVFQGSGTQRLNDEPAWWLRREQDHVMAHQRVILELQDLGDLFDPPHPDPLAGRFEDRSGVDQLVEQVDPSQEPLEVVLAISESHQVELDRVQAALGGHCQTQIAQITREADRIRRLGLKELRFGVVFLALCFTLASVVAGSQLGPEWLRGFFGEGLVIIGWIALWHPVDMLLFERLPMRRRRRILTRISSASVSLG